MRRHRRVRPRLGNQSPRRTTLFIGIVLVAVMSGPLSASAWGQCSCPWVGDVNADGSINVSDLTMMINSLFSLGPLEQDPGCPTYRIDINADGMLNIRDIIALNDSLFHLQSAIIDPCDCAAQPALCAEVHDPTPGEPGNSVVVESKSVFAGATDVRIPIRLSNDVEIRGSVVPLIVREVTPGAFITAAQQTFEERLVNHQPYFHVNTQHAIQNGACPGGFGVQTQYNSNTKNPVGASPEGFLFISSTLLNPDLTPGSDVDGSLVLTVDVGNVLGTFEIDTTCIDPDHHLLFVQNDPGTSTPIVPEFTKGIITIAENQPPVALCQDVTVSAGPLCGPADASIDNGSFDPEGGAVIITQSPPGPYPYGATLVTLTIEDELGLTAQCQATVTVEDTTPPEIVCPDDIQLNIAPVYQGWVVAFNVTATDECPGDVTVVSSQESGTFFPNGTTEVFCTATDAAGNTAECSFLVTIVAMCYDRLGDANCDGVMDAVDVNLIIQAVYFNKSIPPCTSPPGAE